MNFSTNISLLLCLDATNPVVTFTNSLAFSKLFVLICCRAKVQTKTWKRNCAKFRFVSTTHLF